MTTEINDPAAAAGSVAHNGSFSGASGLSATAASDGWFVCPELADMIERYAAALAAHQALAEDEEDSSSLDEFTHPMRVTFRPLDPS